MNFGPLSTQERREQQVLRHPYARFFHGDVDTVLDSLAAYLHAEAKVMRKGATAVDSAGAQHTTFTTAQIIAAVVKSFTPDFILTVISGSDAGT